MGIETKLIFQGIEIPRVYGTITRNTIKINKIFNNTSIQTSFVFDLTFYVIQTINGIDYIDKEPIEIKKNLYEPYQFLIKDNENIYEIIYQILLQKDPDIKNYLQDITTYNNY